MGDRCFISLTFHRDDTVEVLKAFGLDTEGENLIDDLGKNFENVEEDGATIEVSGPECNYACYDEITALARAGVAFYGYNSAGDNYGEEMWCGFEGQYASVASLEGIAVVTLDYKTGKVIEHSLTAARRWLELNKKADESIKTRPAKEAPAMTGGPG